MSEKFEPQGYRNELAESLKVKRTLGEEGRELAKSQLELEKDTIEYKRADIQHIEDNLAKKEKSDEKKENIESPKLEWGPELGRTYYRTAIEKIAELNKGLAEGEKPWRLPTRDELLAEFKKIGSTPAGFRSDWHWSDTITENESHLVVDTVNMTNGYVLASSKGNFGHQARCVR